MKFAYAFFLLVLSSLVLADTVPESAKEPSNEEAFAKLKKVLARQVGPYNERAIQRVGNKTIQFESFISIEADPKIGNKILTDFKSYPKWAIKNINQKPGGGSYYVKVQELTADSKDTSLLHGFFNIDVPVFKSSLHGIFKLSSEEKDGVLTVRGKLQPDPNSILLSAEAVLKSFPTEKPSPYRWIYVYSTVVLRHWLLYEALPERLLKRESGERIQIVLDNYQSEEDRVRTLH